MPKVVWKIETYAQGLTFRTVALAEGVCSLWNSENGLAAVILGRSLVETAGMAWSFWDDLKNATATGRLKNIDDVAMSYTFSTRWPKFAEGIPPTPSIMNLIDRLDRTLFRDKKAKHVRKVYDDLSEFAHPNWIGTVGFFGDLDTQKYEMKFDPKGLMPERLLSDIIACAGSITIIELSLDHITETIPQIWKIADGKTETDPTN